MRRQGNTDAHTALGPWISRIIFFKRKSVSSLEYKQTLISIRHLKICGKVAQTHHRLTLSFRNRALLFSGKLSPWNYFTEGMLKIQKKNKIKTDANKLNR